MLLWIALLAASALAYCRIGWLFVERAMDHVFNNAASDPDFFEMAVSDRHLNLSMLIPKVMLALFWPLVGAAIMLMLMVRWLSSPEYRTP